MYLQRAIKYSNMARIPCSVIAIAHLVVGSVLAQSFSEPEVASFEELFVFEDTVCLDLSVTVGTIKTMDISERSEIAFIDEIARKAYVFTSTGALLHTLDPE